MCVCVCVYIVRVCVCVCVYVVRVCVCVCVCVCMFPWCYDSVLITYNIECYVRKNIECEIFNVKYEI